MSRGIERVMAGVKFYCGKGCGYGSFDPLKTLAHVRVHHTARVAGESQLVFDFAQ